MKGTCPEQTVECELAWRLNGRQVPTIRCLEHQVVFYQDNSGQYLPLVAKP